MEGEGTEGGLYSIPLVLPLLQVLLSYKALCILFVLNNNHICGCKPQTVMAAQSIKAQLTQGWLWYVANDE